MPNALENGVVKAFNESTGEDESEEDLQICHSHVAGASFAKSPPHVQRLSDFQGRQLSSNEQHDHSVRFSAHVSPGSCMRESDASWNSRRSLTRQLSAQELFLDEPHAQSNTMPPTIHEISRAHEPGRGGDVRAGPDDDGEWSCDGDDLGGTSDRNQAPSPDPLVPRSGGQRASLRGRCGSVQSLFKDVQNGAATDLASVKSTGCGLQSGDTASAHPKARLPAQRVARTISHTQSLVRSTGPLARARKWQRIMPHPSTNVGATPQPGVLSARSDTLMRLVSQSFRGKKGSASSSREQRASQWQAKARERGSRRSMMVGSEAAFLLRRQRKELKLRKRAETRHEELVGTLLIRATDDYRCVERVEDLLPKDLKRGGMGIVLYPPQRRRLAVSGARRGSVQSISSADDDERSCAGLDSRWPDLPTARRVHSKHTSQPHMPQAPGRPVSGKMFYSGVKQEEDDGAPRILRHLRSRGAAKRQALDALLGLAAVFTAVVIPYDAAFPERTARYSGAWVLSLRVLFGVDLLLGFFTAVDAADNQTHAIGKTALAYLRGWFGWDLVAFLPLDLLGVGRPEVVRLLLCAKVTKISLLCAPIGAFCARLVQMTKEQRALLVMTQLLLLVLACSHWAACAWWFVQKEQVSGIVTYSEYIDEWADRPSSDITWLDGVGEEGFTRRYMLSLSVVLMLFGGNSNALMLTVTEQAVAACIMLVGSMIMALMVSQIGQVANTVLASQREYTHKMDTVSVAMDKLRLPGPLRARVEQYYAYLWSRHGTFDVRHQLTDELSTCLRSEMNIFFHRRLIAKVHGITCPWPNVSFRLPAFAFTHFHTHQCPSHYPHVSPGPPFRRVLVGGNPGSRGAARGRGPPAGRLHCARGYAYDGDALYRTGQARAPPLPPPCSCCVSSVVDAPSIAGAPFWSTTESASRCCSASARCGARSTSASCRSSARRSPARPCMCSPRRTSTCTCCTEDHSKLSSAPFPSCWRASRVQSAPHMRSTSRRRRRRPRHGAPSARSACSSPSTPSSPPSWCRRSSTRCSRRRTPRTR